MKGEQIFDALGQRWVMFLGNAAQCSVEAQYEKGFFAVVADALPDVDPETLVDAPAMAAAMRGIHLSVLRDLAWHGLRKHHPMIDVDEVSDIIDELGQAAFGSIIGAAIRAAQGDGGGDDAAPGNAPPKPNRATRRGARTGKPS